MNTPQPDRTPTPNPEAKFQRDLILVFSTVVAAVVFFTVTLPWIRRGMNAGRSAMEEPVGVRIPVADTVARKPVREDGRPAFGEYVYVEQFPVPLTKAQPLYPDKARSAGIEGTVHVHALIDETGRVVDTRIAQSVPELDLAAVRAVEKWTFEPARAEGKPVAVWVAIPIRFRLD